MSGVGRIGPHERPVAKVLADVHGEELVWHASLDAARSDPDAAVVVEGDSGGQVYLTCPARLVRCDETTLRQLAEDVDALGWAEPDDLGVWFQRLPLGSGVPGGMGGGAVVDGLWLHPTFEAPALRQDVQAVLDGRLARIDPARRDEVVWRGPLRADFVFGAPLDDLPLPDPARGRLRELEAILAAARPAHLDRAGSELVVFAYGVFAIVLRDDREELEVVLHDRPGNRGEEEVALGWGEVDFEGYEHDFAVDALLRALCGGRVEARPVLDVDGEPDWHLRAWPPGDTATHLGDACSIDVFEDRIGPVVALPTFP